jgi:ankyrin repeat protein
MAARFGNLRAVTILLKHGARFDVRDNDGWTALHSSILGGEPLIARALVEAIRTSNDKQQSSFVS